jgi:hypothetical protein
MPRDVAVLGASLSADPGTGQNACSASCTGVLIRPAGFAWIPNYGSSSAYSRGLMLRLSTGWASARPAPAAGPARGP